MTSFINVILLLLHIIIIIRIVQQNKTPRVSSFRAIWWCLTEFDFLCMELVCNSSSAMELLVVDHTSWNLILFVANPHHHANYTDVQQEIRVGVCTRAFIHFNRRPINLRFEFIGLLLNYNNKKTKVIWTSILDYFLAINGFVQLHDGLWVFEISKYIICISTQ